MTILKNHDRFWRDEVAVFGTYMPWGVHQSYGGTRADFPEHSALILALKRGEDAAVVHFANMIEPELCDGIAIAVVPSHDPASTSSGLPRLAGLLASKGRRIDASGCLVRAKKIDKLARGGNRSVGVHLGSIVVQRAELVRGRSVLLLDDVTKTGNSLDACSQLLLQAGANTVLRATIGKT